MDSTLWLDHLSRTLSDQGLVAYLWHADNDRLEWRGDVRALLGTEDESGLDSAAQLNRMINPQDLPRRMGALHQALSDGTTAFSTTYRLTRANGMVIDVSESGSVTTDPQTGQKTVSGLIKIIDPAQFAASLRGGASARSGATEIAPSRALSFGAPGDGRRVVAHKIAEWSESGIAASGSGYLLVVGIDRVSMFNEAFGAGFTDELIEKTGLRLRQMMSGHGEIDRIDGNVYAMFFHEASHAEMAAVAHYVLNAFYETPLMTSKGPIGVGVSIGGILVRPQTKDPADFIAKAEVAMRSAKDRGRGCFVSYNEIAGEGQETRKILQSGDAFIQALRENRVRLAFQPVVNSKTGAVSFHESLIRFIDEQGKIHSAGQFIPAIEKLGLTRLVDRYALRMAIQELDMFPDLSLSVNVSNLTLADPDWLRGLVYALREHPHTARRLMIEITESAAMHDVEKTTRIVKTLRDLGCRVALDDFGAGYTAFAQLKQLDVDIVKIDKAFIRDMEDKKNHLFVRTLQALADGVDIETVGEGAETMSEARLLAEDGINHIQGYAFGFPSVERVWLPKGHDQRKLVLPAYDNPDNAVADGAFTGILTEIMSRT